MNTFPSPTDLKLFYDCCRAIIHANRHEKVKAVDWAVNYCHAGLTLSTREAISAQCLYIIDNIKHWRGPQAANTRASLKQLARELTE